MRTEKKPKMSLKAKKVSAFSVFKGRKVIKHWIHLNLFCSQTLLFCNASLTTSPVKKVVFLVLSPSLDVYPRVHSRGSGH